MCPRTRSILVATAMLVFSLLAAALIANMARSGDSVREKAAMRNSQVSFSERTEQSVSDSRLASMGLLR